jgi:hypothetical protein
VLQEPKTEKSRRTLALPAVCLEALKAHRTRQLQELDGDSWCGRRDTPESRWTRMAIKGSLTGHADRRDAVVPISSARTTDVFQIRDV